MASDNLKTLEKIHEGYRERDFSLIDKYFDSDVDIYQSELLPWGGHYHGHKGAQEFYSKLLGSVDASVKVEHFIDAGDHIVEVGQTKGKLKKNGKPMNVAQVQVWKFRNGKVTGFEAFVDTPPVLAALRT
jgi:ketosteroid isomerase-like protein